MGITLPRGVFLAAVLVVAGLAFLFAYRVTGAACCPLPHGQSASGIPYWPGAYQLSNHYTYQVTEHTQAIVRWNNATARDYLHKWDSFHDIEDMRQYMVYSGSGWDINLGAWFTFVTGTPVPSCKDWTDSDAEARGTEAFEWGWGTSNNDSEMTVVCLNVTALGYVNGFDLKPAEDRIKGVTHEMGHSLHLDHDTNGVMNSCWCLNITQHEADVIHWWYNATPP